ncbi:glycosyltransferase family 2 protein [Tateyamaria sp.]|uniref:glycosyltransferase family 2 protein n=1 Tax=Tateyamaria sp. TaxID=1929288 RepID=UPI0032A11361
MLSLIVTFYDETAFLRTALRSVCNQGIDDLELIVINDNPETFDTSALAQLTAGFDVRVIHHTENRGLSAARNTGIVAANGTHIGFLDADDYYTHQGLAAQYAYARETAADITHAGCYLGAESSVHSSVLQRDARLHMTQRVVKGRMAAQESQFIVSSWSSIYRAAFLEKNQVWFDPEQHKFEDRLFVLNAVTAARSVAFLGRAVRVWRRRANSISSAATTPETHLLQVQLLEKCMAHIRKASATHNLAPRYEKRELFNSVSRLIWDMDILAPLVAKDPAYAEMGMRISRLLGDDSFGQDIFSDPMVAATSRVGMRTKRGLISRTDFFALHRAWRLGEFEQAQTIMHACARPVATPAKAHSYPQKRLILHIGLHKTGTTFVQHHLLHHREALRRSGVLLPQTGFDTEITGRPGALSGHQGLVRALRSNDDDPLWDALHKEIKTSPARTVLITAENLGFPTAPDRDALIARLFARLGSFAQIDVIAMARSPDTYAEAFYSEWVTSAHPGGARSIQETLVDHGEALTNLAALFAPFEAATGRTVGLDNFDAAKVGTGLWPAFCTLAGLPTNLPDIPCPRYDTPDRESVLLMQAVNSLVANQSRRQALMQAYFADTSRKKILRQSLLSPAQQKDLLDRFATTSAAFCAARGYAPDLDKRRTEIDATRWAAPDAIPLDHLAALWDVGAQIAGDNPTPQVRTTPKPTQQNKKRYSVTIRPRPWVVNLIDRLLRKT